MSSILVTGAGGFVGKCLCVRATDTGRRIRAVIRKANSADNLPEWCEPTVVGEIDLMTGWGEALSGVGTVVHLAARTHIMRNTEAEPLASFRRINVDGTLNLARQSAAAGVKRFVFVSSIHVNGNRSTCPFTEIDTPHPIEPYAVSKWEAEQGLQILMAESGMEVVIIRPPLVYGPNAPGNFGSLVRWVNKCVPLPLGAIQNLRSLVGIDNLVDFIITCIDHPAAANQTFLVADGVDLSTTELIKRVGWAMNKSVRLIPVPAGALKLGAALLGKKMMAQRLCENLQVDISKARKILSWFPPVSLDDGLSLAVGQESKK